MTRLFHGFTVLAGLCAMTLIVGCGGSSSPKVTCDGGACGDARRDTSGNRAEVPAVTPDGKPTVTPDGQPAANSDGQPAVTPDGQPAVTPDGPAVIPDGSARDVPAVIPDGPAVTPDGPAVIPDVRPADVTPVDTAVPTDTPRDATAPSDGRLDTPILNPDGGPDAPAADSVDAPADAPADATVNGEAGDGGCAGALCHDFEGDNPDAGLPAGFTALGTGITWAVVTDTGNKVLQGSQPGSGGTEYIQAGVTTWTDQTIEVRVRFVSLVAGGGNVLRICGRFTSATSAYCLSVSAGTTANTGTILIVKEDGATNPTLGTATGLDIALDDWHTYRFSISGSTSVTLDAFLDGAAAKATATDGTATHTAGAVALSVRNATADFDDLIVTTP